VQDYGTELRRGEGFDVVVVEAERGWLERLQRFLDQSADPANDMALYGWVWR
jgi:hypothetical protein